jgi:hypothetical protein
MPVSAPCHAPAPKSWFEIVASLARLHARQQIAVGRPLENRAVTPLSKLPFANTTMPALPAWSPLLEPTSVLISTPAGLNRYTAPTSVALGLE